MSFDLLNVRAFRILKLELAAMLWIGSVASSCSDADLSGANRTQKTEKKEAAVVEEEGDTAVPPEVLAGAYLSCGEIEAGSPDLIGVAVPSNSEIVGCSVHGKSDGRAIDVTNYRAQWKIIGKDGSEVAAQKVEIRPGARIQWAALVPVGTYENLKSIILDFPGSGKAVVNEPSQLSEGEESVVPGSVTSKIIEAILTGSSETAGSNIPVVADVPSVKCHAENERFKNEKGGCHVVGSKIVIGKFNDDPSQKGTMTDLQKKTMYLTEAHDLCEKDQTGGRDDWHLPSREDILRIREAAPLGHLSFLVTDEFEKSARFKPYNNNGKYGYWTKNKGDYSKDFIACGVAEEWCEARNIYNYQAMSFCVRYVD